MNSVKGLSPNYRNRRDRVVYVLLSRLPTSAHGTRKKKFLKKTKG